VAASAVLTEAVFNSGLRRYAAEGEPWRPEWSCYYFLNESAAPSFLVDVTAYYGLKQKALECHATQFGTTARDTVATRLNTPLFRQMIESRDAQFGAMAGVRWAEGVVVREPILRTTLMKTS
jgi:LmbE family N-acetylglucosaminyl deacetylase